MSSQPPCPHPLIPQFAPCRLHLSRHLSTGEQQFRHPPSPIKPPIPTRPTSPPKKSQPIPPNPTIRPLPTSSFGHLATGEQQSRQSPVQTTPPSPPPPTLAPHKSQPILPKSPKITVQTTPPSPVQQRRPITPHPQRSHHTNHSPSPTNHTPSPKQFRQSPVQTTLPPHAPNARTTQITAHPPNPQKNHSSDNASPDNTSIPTRPTLATTQITAHLPKSHKNHSSDKSPQSRQHLHPHAQRSHHTNHSPSPQIPKITVQTMPQNLTFLDNHLEFLA